MDGGIVGSLIGLDLFKHDYGYEYNCSYIVAAHWVSAFNYANKLGGIVGALASGFAYDKLGQLFAGQLINVCIITFYPICASAYTGEVCPLALRGFAASMTNLAFVIGQFIASGILKGTNGIDNKYSYKVPIATQWAPPAAMLCIIYFCPDPPYWLCKKGRYDAAEKTLRRLATAEVDPSLKLARIKETLRLETTYNDKEKPNFLDCFRGPNFRRLIICVMAYDMQAFTGNILFIDYAVYFFELAGLDSANAFSMNIGLTAIGFVGTCLSWPLASYIGRRTAYFWGCAGLAILLFLIGAIDLAPRSSLAPRWAQCSLMLVCNLIYDITISPFCFVLLAEVSSAKLRGMTIALAAVTCHIVSIIFSVAIPYVLNEDQGNWKSKLRFLFAGLSFLCTLYCFFFLPETKGRTFEELDIMFERRIRSRKFKGYKINGAV